MSRLLLVIAFMIIFIAMGRFPAHSLSRASVVIPAVAVVAIIMWVRLR